MTMNGAMVLASRYFNVFAKPAFQLINSPSIILNLLIKNQHQQHIMRYV